MTNDCVFCQKLESIPAVAENIYCKVISPLDEYRPGHRLVILKHHREDIADEIKNEELFVFIKTIHEEAKEMKKTLKAERIYVCSLCDGVQHLHAHLIPRYKGDATGFKFLAEQERKYDAIRCTQKSHQQ